MEEQEGFPEAIKRQLREAVGAFCSAPHCGEQTGGYDCERGRSLFSGDAAHIFGARKRAARYDDLPIGWNRHGCENGIWLCAICHRQVDQAPNMFPGELLLEWKDDAVRRYASGYRRRNQPPYGTDIHEELRRAYAFLELLRPVYNSFSECLRSVSRFAYVQAFSDEAPNILQHLVGPSIVSQAWGNKHPCWTFIEDFQCWQNEMVRMAKLLLRHPEFRVLSNRAVDWRYSVNSEGDKEFLTDVAEDIHLFMQQFERFENFLQNYRGPMSSAGGLFLAVR